MFRRAVRLAGALAAGAVLLPSSASADSLKRYDQDGVPRRVVERFALTNDERRALDISSLRVTGAEAFGVMLEVRRVVRSQRGLLLSVSGDGELLLEECYQPGAGG